MKHCVGCGRFVKSYTNYCSWECSVALAKRSGGKVIAPNNLPIKCIKFDNTMLEHEHADHPDYKFPVSIEYAGELPSNLSYEDKLDYEKCEAALIYNDRSIAITIYECCYDMFSLRSGKHIGGDSWDKNWRLSKTSIDKILEGS